MPDSSCITVGLGLLRHTRTEEQTGKALSGRLRPLQNGRVGTRRGPASLKPGVGKSCHRKFRISPGFPGRGAGRARLMLDAVLHQRRLSLG